jgi:hypothetical protein
MFWDSLFRETALTAETSGKKFTPFERMEQDFKVVFSLYIIFDCAFKANSLWVICFLATCPMGNKVRHGCCAMLVTVVRRNSILANGYTPLGQASILGRKQY